MREDIKKAFDTVQASDALKERTKAAVADAMAKAPKQRGWVRRRIAISVACCCLVITLIGGGVSYVTPVAAISVDVNPSIEMVVNRYDRVVGVKSYNEEGEALLDGQNLQNKVYTEALDEVLRDDTLSAYMTDNQPVSITVSGADEAASKSMLAQASNCAKAVNENITCHSGKSEDVERAHEAGMSTGKYRAYQELLKYYPDLTAEEVNHMTMHEINTMLEDAGGNTYNGEGQGQGNGHHGNGQHRNK